MTIGTKDLCEITRIVILDNVTLRNLLQSKYMHFCRGHTFRVILDECWH